MSEEKTLEDMIDSNDSEYIQYISRKALKELLNICETHGISKQGLIEEIKHGIDPEKDTGNVITGNNKGVTDLDLEEIAMRGDKRSQLDLDDRQKDIPRKLVEHELGV